MRAIVWNVHFVTFAESVTELKGQSGYQIHLEFIHSLYDILGYVCLFEVFRLTRFTYLETSPLPVKGCKF